MSGDEHESTTILYNALSVHLHFYKYLCPYVYSSIRIGCHEQYVNHFDVPLNTVIILTQGNIARVSIHKPLL